MLSLSLLVLLSLGRLCRGDWDQWWTYDGISGPTYWGVINPAWSLCQHGRLQSPVDVSPRALSFDPSLKRVNVDKQRVSGVLYNTGQSLTFRVERSRGSDLPVNITGGPLSYRSVLVDESCTMCGHAF